MTKYKDFTDFLTYKFGVEEPAVLDDEWPDRFNDWLADLDVDTLIKWADEYAEQVTTDHNTTIESMSNTGRWQLERINHLEAEMDKAPALVAELASLRSMLGRAASVIGEADDYFGSCWCKKDIGYECPQCGWHDKAQQVLSEIRGVKC